MIYRQSEINPKIIKKVNQKQRIKTMKITGKVVMIPRQGISKSSNTLSNSSMFSSQCSSK